MRTQRFLLRAVLVLATLGLPVVASSAPAHAASGDLGPWIIYNGNSGQCVDVPHANYADNVQLEQWNCYDSPRAANQQWLQTYIGTYTVPSSVPYPYGGTAQKSCSVPSWCWPRSACPRPSCSRSRRRRLPLYAVSRPRGPTFPGHGVGPRAHASTKAAPRRS